MSHVRSRTRPVNRHPAFQPASDPQKAIFLKHYREDRKRGAASHAAGITKAQLKHAMATDPAFLGEIEKLDEFFLERLEGIAEQLAEDHDVPMIKFLLEKRLPERYGRQSQITVTHQFNSAEEVAQLSEEEFEATCQSLGLSSE